MRIRMITPEDAWRASHWCQRAVLTAFVVPMLLTFVWIVASEFRDTPAIIVLLSLAVLTSMIVRLIKDCHHAEHWWIAALSGAYLGLVIYLSVAFLTPLRVTVYGWDIDLIVCGCVFTLVYGGVYILAWQVLRIFWGPLVVQNGTLCPYCGYCLIGLAENVCPECGRPFSVEELSGKECPPSTGRGQ